MTEPKKYQAGEPQPFEANLVFTDEGVPAGGSVWGTGFCISLQRGTIAMTKSGELQPNGVFTQTLIAVIIFILKRYQHSAFANKYNDEAIAHLEAAQDALRRRLLDRKDRGVLNTHKP
jgi:hypothetical protein